MIGAKRRAARDEIRARSEATIERAESLADRLENYAGCEIGKKIYWGRNTKAFEAMGGLMVAGSRPEASNFARRFAEDRADLMRDIAEKLEACDSCHGDVYDSATVEIKDCPLMKAVLDSALQGGNYFTDRADEK